MSHSQSMPKLVGLPPCTCGAHPPVIVNGSYCLRHINCSHGTGMVVGPVPHPKPDEETPELDAEARVPVLREMPWRPLPYGDYRSVPDTGITLDEWREQAS